jgi:hypothetical protein
MRLRTTTLAVALCCGCSAQLSGTSGPSIGGIDPLPDAAGPGPAPDAMPVPKCTSRSVYLNFDGQKLTRGPSDATQNQASWMQIGTGTAPRYQTNNTDRDTAIQTIVDGVRTQLSQFPITVTTTRPTAGNYVMIVFGGRAGAVGSSFGGAVNKLDCGDTRPNDVAWISDNVSPAQAVINTAVGAVGFGLGLTATSDPKDCMCAWDNGCVSDDTAPCKLGSPIDRDPKANQLCPDLTPEDEIAVFRTAFCS